MKEDVTEKNMECGRVSSGSLMPLEQGKGYSKRGEETSKGVPRMEEGECSERLLRLRRGFSEGVRGWSFSAASEEGYMDR